MSRQYPSLPYKVHYQQILFQDLQIAYVDEGKGDKVLLFIHGLGHSMLDWQKNLGYLRQHYRCIAVDLPGNGLSATGDYPYSLHFFAAGIADFIRKMGLTNVYLVGHSMGGQISMTLALQHPTLISGLILCAPAGFEVFTEWEKSLYRNTMYFVDMVSNEENSLRKGLQNSFYILPDSASGLAQQLVETMKLQDSTHYRKMLEKCISAMLDEPVYEQLADIAHPVLVIFGERDNLIPNKFIHPTSTRKLAETATGRFPNAVLHTIGQCGHFVQWEKAGKVNNLIRHFLG